MNSRIRIRHKYLRQCYKSGSYRRSNLFATSDSYVEHVQYTSLFLVAGNNQGVILKMVQFEGKFQFVSQNNFEEFAKVLGDQNLVNTVLQPRPSFELSKNGDEWTFTSSSGDNTYTKTFKMNVPFEETLPSLPDRKFQVCLIHKII